MSAQNFQSTKEVFADFCKLVQDLRHPVTGCPWDLKQTHETLAKYLIEEAYEAATVMKENDAAKMCDELGDVLLQVVLNAQLAMEAKTFNIDDVIRSIHTKMVRRHPHVFGSEEDRKGRELPQIMKRWEQIKKEENAEQEEAPYLEKKGAHKVFPSTTQAYKIGKLLKSVDFDCSTADEVFDDLLSEIQELKEEWQKSKNLTPELHAEMGDVYFSLAQLCRHLNLEPELVATEGNYKMLRRFGQVERLAKSRGLNFETLSREELNALWNDVKKTEKR